MSEQLTFVLNCIWYMLPMGVANMAPVIVQGSLHSLAVPVDRLFGHRVIFGEHKTIRGIIAALVFGTLAFLWQREAALSWAWAKPLGFFSYSAMPLWFGLLAGLGAITGDLLKSGFKRRMRIAPGRPFFSV